MQLDRGNLLLIPGWIWIVGCTGREKIKSGIPELKVSTEATSDNDGLARFTVDASDLQLWSPDTPKLYRVEISTDTDRVGDEVGFRTIETRGPDILLNDRPIFLRGIDIHEQQPD